MVAPDPQPLDALIIGGGVAGLVCAHRLKQLGRNIMLVESQAHVGGTLNSERVGEYLIEWGAHTSSRSSELELLIDELGLRAQFAATPPAVRNRFLVRPDAQNLLRLQAVPLSLREAVGTPLLSLRAKAKVVAEAFQRQIDEQDCTVAQFIERRFGNEFLQTLIAPALNGVWAGDVERMSAKHSLPRLWEAQRRGGSVLRGMLLKPRSNTKPPRGIFSFRSGMKTLPFALANQLGATVLLSTRVDSIAQEASPGRGIAVQLTTPTGPKQIEARYVVIATSAEATAALISSPTIAAAPYSAVGLLHLAYPKRAISHPLNGFGVLIAPRFERAVLGAIFVSSLFPDRAPSDTHLLSCFVGGARRPELANVEDSRVQNRVIDELQSIFAATERPAIVAAKLLPKAIPSFELGQEAIVQEAAELERRIPGLKLLGNWREGISVPDRVRLAEATARSIHSQLVTQSPPNAGKAP